VWSRATLVCVTHDLHDTLAFDRVLVMAGGAIVESGAPHALAAVTESHYARLLALERDAQSMWTDSQTWRHLRLDRGEIAWQAPHPKSDGERTLTAHVAPR
jgi:ATP-binding cassette subfamily B protein